MASSLGDCTLDHSDQDARRYVMIDQLVCPTTAHDGNSNFLRMHMLLLLLATFSGLSLRSADSCGSADSCALAGQCAQELLLDGQGRSDNSSAQTPQAPHRGIRVVRLRKYTAFVLLILYRPNEAQMAEPRGKRRYQAPQYCRDIYFCRSPT